MMEAELLKCLVSHLLVVHPLPWRLERDWTWEVYDSRSQIVAKFPRPEPAQAFIDYAVREQAEHEQFMREWEAQEGM